ncbi:hypothetical protein NPIL_349801 [Nephila pilipes]|nr:hypothetical protein NPIL_285371 [Nephila pilipes]GFU32631.1 hypothetical protein NPIL_349801 [Nephila pilipes]
MKSAILLQKTWILTSCKLNILCSCKVCLLTCSIIFSVRKDPLDELAQIVGKIHEVSRGNLTIGNIESKGLDGGEALLAENSNMEKKKKNVSLSKPVTYFHPRSRSLLVSSLSLKIEQKGLRNRAVGWKNKEQICFEGGRSMQV